MTTRMMQKVLQLSFSDQLVQVVPEVLAILRGMFYGLGDIGNKSSDCTSWILPPSYSAT